MSAPNKCWLQLYCDLSSSAASDSLPQNSPVLLPKPHFWQLLCSNTRPPTTPCVCVCVCVASWQRGWICVVTASTDALIKYFSTLSCSCLSYWAHVKSADRKKTRFLHTHKKKRSFHMTELWFCASFSSLDTPTASERGEWFLEATFHWILNCKVYKYELSSYSKYGKN